MSRKSRAGREASVRAKEDRAEAALPSPDPRLEAYRVGVVCLVVSALAAFVYAQARGVDPLSALYNDRQAQSPSRTGGYHK